jgi:hypothetical protein
MKQCENCDTEHDGKYGSGRFCSNFCSRSFSTKNNRSTRNQKISSSLKGRKPHSIHKLTPEDARRGSLIAKQNRQSYIENRRKTAPFEQLKKSDIYFRLLFEQGNKCAVVECTVGILWLNKPLRLQIDHIDGNRQNNGRENLRLLCPICHTQTANFGSKNASLEGKSRQRETCRQLGLSSKSKFTYS